jgi:sensor c-di-GMP phosphodiesterase-like protein
MLCLGFLSLKGNIIPPMTRTLKQHVWFTLVITVLVSALGAGCGYLLGCTITLHMAENALEQYALRVRDTIDRFAGEERSLISKMNASPYPYCSDAEIIFFRKLLFRSEYLRDAGRIRNGKIDCSANMGRLKPPFVLPSPNNAGADGNKVYLFVPPDQVDKQKSFAVQIGESYVITSEYVLTHLGPSPMHYTTTATDIRSGRVVHLRGETLNMDLQPFATNGKVWKNDTLYITRCSLHNYFTCATAYISISEALRIYRDQISICTIMGGMVGFFLGIFCSIVYRRNLSMESQLLRAIHKGRLQMVYQPIVEINSGRVVEAEALVRWTDEDGYAISPVVFVPLAEERGFVGELTAFVVRQALEDFGEILRRHPEFRVNINITATDLADAGFLSMLERALEKERVAPHNLAIEITEGSTVKHREASEAIRHLREQGHSVQIDDFGTGYSSLAYLHDLSVDAIKIDRAFVQVIGTDAVTVGILPQILAMARALKLQVIAEGIETVEQAAYFAGSEMPILGQGWLFGRPVAAKNFQFMLNDAEKKEACTS